MQEESEKLIRFKQAIGEIFKEIRNTNSNISLSKLAYEYDIDKGSLSKLERGFYDCRLSTAWKIAEASGVKFSKFAELLEENLGSDFKLMDE